MVKHKKVILSSGAGVFVLVASLVVIYFLHQPDENAIPQLVRSQLSFVPGVVKGESTTMSGAPENIKYDADNKLLTYIQAYKGVSLVISQQPTPESFSDIPQTYDKLLEKMNSQQTFDSVNGKVSITYPTELKGAQTAVLNTKGTLMFVRSDQKLSIDDWRQFFNSLNYQN